MIRTNIFLVIVLLGSIFYSYGWRHLVYDELRVPAEGFELEIVPGTSLKQIAQYLHQKEVLSHPRIWRWYAVARGYASKIQAGEYLLEQGTTPIKLLHILRVGGITQYSFTIVEGQRVKDVLINLHDHNKIQSTIADLTDQEIIDKLNLPAVNLEGALWPETYYFTAKTKDVDFLRRAYLNMQVRLQDMWLARDPNITLQTPYEALILASIIEKESGSFDEYTEISGVYHRRLVKKMRLQADPTVIYAMGDDLDGTLLRRHLTYESPYNTYTNTGLPPTPIAIPSRNAIEAALHPAAGDTLYFVSTGDGRHVFSSNLKDHNKAVQEVRNNRK